MQVPLVAPVHPRIHLCRRHGDQELTQFPLGKKLPKPPLCKEMKRLWLSSSLRRR